VRRARHKKPHCNTHEGIYNSKPRREQDNYIPLGKNGRKNTRDEPQGGGRVVRVEAKANNDSVKDRETVQHR